MRERFLFSSMHSREQESLGVLLQIFSKKMALAEALLFTKSTFRYIYALIGVVLVTSLWPVFRWYNLFAIAILVSLFTSIEILATSVSVAAFLLWHGPRGFLLLKRRFGTIFRIGKHNLVVFNLEVIKHCMVGNPQNYDKGGRAARLMGDVVGAVGVLGALDEKDHEPSHRVLNPHTKRGDRIREYEQIVMQETERMLQELESLQCIGGQKVDMHVSLNGVFFRVLYRFMFGMELSDQEFAQVFHVISRLEKYAAVVGFVPARLLPWYKLYRYDIPPLMNALDNLVEGIMSCKDRSVGSPLQEMMMESKDGDGSLDEARVKDTVKNLLFAGATTAANALGWAIHCLSLDDVLKVKAMEAAKVQDVSFFKNVCLEVNRVYPQANVVTRRAVSEEVVEGQRIERGCVLVIPIIALHHDDHFEEAEMFKPGRWDEYGMKSPPLMGYIPFTAGPRQCIGQALFNRVAPLLLMRVLAAFCFTPSTSNLKPSWPNAVLPPTRGFKMTVNRIPN